MEKQLYNLRGIVTTVISPFAGEDKHLDLDSLANEIDMACKAGTFVPVRGHFYESRAWSKRRKRVPLRRF